MDKARKGLSTRKPPVPSDSHSVIDAWIRGAMPGLQSIVERLDTMICDALPDARYAIKWNKAYYGSPHHGWAIEVVAYHVSVNIVFLAGADFDPPPPLGTTDRSRYIKVTTMEDLDRPELHPWMRDAGQRPGWT